MYNWEFDITNATKKVVPGKKTAKKKATNATEGAMDTVEGEDNIIYFYAGVSMKENFKLNKEISSIGRQMEMVAVYSLETIGNTNAHDPQKNRLQ